MRSIIPMFVLAGLACAAPAGVSTSESPNTMTIVQPAATQGPRITAVGDATVYRAPDRATISLGAVAESMTSEKAQSDLNATMERVLAAIRAVGGDGLVVQTQGLSLSPKMTYEPDRAPKTIGYIASNTLSIRVDDLSKCGKLIDAAVAAGANQLNGITFSLRDEREARSAALAEAARNARAEAGVLAEALGLRLGAVIEASVGTPQVVPIFARSAGLRMEAAMAPTPVEAGDVAVNASVTVVFHAAN